MWRVSFDVVRRGLGRIALRVQSRAPNPIEELSAAERFDQGAFANIYSGVHLTLCCLVVLEAARRHETRTIIRRQLGGFGTAPYERSADDTVGSAFPPKMSFKALDLNAAERTE